MSRPRFLADHDLRERIIIGLLRRLPDAEFLRCRDIGLETRPDADVLEYAASHGLIVITHDVNTMVASAYDRLRDGQAMTGLLVAQQANPGSVRSRPHAAVYLKRMASPWTRLWALW